MNTAVCSDCSGIGAVPWVGYKYAERSLGRTVCRGGQRRTRFLQSDVGRLIFPVGT